MLFSSSWRALSAALVLGSLTAPLMAQPAGSRAPSSIAQPAAAAAAKSEPVRVLVLPSGETTLASPVTGRINTLHVGLGLPFREGAVLVSLDCQEPQARLGMAKADLASATDQYEAKLRMQGLDQASDVEVSLAASAVAKAKAQIDLYNFQISQCSIRAPWSGSTAKLHVRSHMTVTAGQPLLDLVRAGVLYLKLNVPSTWVSKLHMGHEFEVTIDETGKTYPAKVRRINSRIDPVSQTVELEATMLKTYSELLPGMSGFARFTGMP
ncbi:MAG: efflux RND transporter periplasmic adaptor subunit [Burkholderiaceae bacterium]